MARAEAALLTLAALIMGVAFLVLDPSGPTPQAWSRAMLGGGAALAGLLAATGAGGALLKVLAPQLLGDDRSAIHAVVAGLLLWSLLASGLAAAGLFHPPVARALVAVLAAGWLARPAVRLPAVGPLALLVGCVVLFPGLIDALAPPVDTDELYQHLALPKQILELGGLLGGPLHPDGSRPQILPVIYASLMALGGETAPRLFHLLLTALTLSGVSAVGTAWLGKRGAWAGLLLATSHSVIHGAGLAATDLPAALAVLAALDASLRGRAIPLALAAGLALGIKYTAGGAIAGIFLVAALPWRTRIVAATAALALVAPWWLRNVVDGLHPLFPFLGWDTSPVHADLSSAAGAQGLRFQYLEKYGAGRDLLSFLALPWNAVMTARIDDFRFLGRVSPAFLALLPTALLALRQPIARRLALAATAAALFWAMGPHWLRYLLPGLPLIALALTAGVPSDSKKAAGALLLCVVAGLPANLGPRLIQAADRLPAATGHEARQPFLERHHPPAASIAWANQHLPDDAVVALFFDWSTYLLDRPVLLGSVEDHVPTRVWLLTRGDQSLVDLQAAGATHLIVTRLRFLDKIYPFLSKEELDGQLNGPVDQLDELLLSQATLIHQQGGTRVYRLGGPTATSEDSGLTE